VGDGTSGGVGVEDIVMSSPFVVRVMVMMLVAGVVVHVIVVAIVVRM